MDRVVTIPENCECKFLVSASCHEGLDFLLEMMFKTQILYPRRFRVVCNASHEARRNKALLRSQSNVSTILTCWTIKLLGGHFT
jgi:hypothetical protein